MNAAKTERKSYHRSVILGSFVTANTSFPLLANPNSVNDSNSFAEASDALFLPPPFSLVSKGRFIVTINETTSSTFITNNNNYLADPSGDLVDTLSIIASQALLNIYDLWRKVAENVDVATRSAEGHNHCLIIHNCLGLRV